MQTVFFNSNETGLYMKATHLKWPISLRRTWKFDTFSHGIRCFKYWSRKEVEISKIVIDKALKW